MPSHPIPSLANNVVELIERAEVQPLHHAIFVLAPVEKAVVRDYLKALPQRAPLTLFAFPAAVPTGCVSQLLDELDSIPFPTEPVPFDAAAQAIISLAADLVSPCWVRLFLQTPPLGATESPLLTFV
jgi:hypothetical protein